MKKAVSAIFLFLLLTGCSGSSSDTSVAIANVSSSSVSQGWTAYRSAALGWEISYPASLYSAEPYTDSITTAGKKIGIEGVRFGDAVPEGNFVRVYRTRDSGIINYLTQDKPFAHGSDVNGISYQEFEFAGMANMYGYMTEKNGWYEVLESSWGPQNPTTEQMLRSWSFEP
jgi:hypothetical protein